MSTALWACMTRPRVPTLRALRCIASQAPVTSNGSRPVTTGPSSSVITAAAAAEL